MAHVGRGEKNPLIRSRHRWDTTIKMSPEEIWNGTDWIHLVQDRDDKWCALVNTVINLSIS